jgi:hypothetical protein
LAIVILFLSTGIHEVTSHTPESCPNLAKQAQEAFAVLKPTGHADGDHCNACFFSQLLNQCIFPVSDKPFLPEFLRSRARPSAEAALSRALGSRTNRGPPGLQHFPDFSS